MEREEAVIYMHIYACTCMPKIEISEKARDALRKEGHKGETYTEIILGLVRAKTVDDGR